jgi:hypothetical protein
MKSNNTHTSNRINTTEYKSERALTGGSEMHLIEREDTLNDD